MKVTLDLYQLKNIISDMVQVGYMNAVKCYEPTKDSIRGEKWPDGLPI